MSLSRLTDYKMTDRRFYTPNQKLIPARICRSLKPVNFLQTTVDSFDFRLQHVELLLILGGIGRLVGEVFGDGNQAG
jgi:hypothetical protein